MVIKVFIKNIVDYYLLSEFMPAENVAEDIALNGYLKTNIKIARIA